MTVLQKRVQCWAAGLAGSLLVRALHWTWRVRLCDERRLFERVRTREGRFLFAFWHRHLLSLLCPCADHPFVLPVSEHRDGEYIAQVMRRFGLLPVRGSTTRGGLKVLRALMEAAAKGRSPAITPDGPRGPRFSVQPGFALVARRCQLPVCVIGMAASSAWVLSSWDRLVIPKPRSRVVIVVEEAIPVRELGKEQDKAALCARLQRCLFETTQRAREILLAESR